MTGYWRRSRPANGLAPLEMVAALPLLMCLMAAMYYFGAAAVWKVRALSVARNMVWSTRWPRTGTTMPRPVYWPVDGATSSTAGPDNAPAIDDTRVQQPVVRGPLPAAQVNSNLLDPTRGLREGQASVQRKFPLPGTLGTRVIRAEDVILDDKWQHRRMGLSSNITRRIPILYALQHAPQALADAYVQAVMAIYNAPCQQDLRPLGPNDDEWAAYGARFGWGTGSPDYYPRLYRFCSLDMQIAGDAVKNLIERIQGTGGLARRVAQGFINLYQRVIDAINAAGGDAAETDALQQKIDALKQFLDSL
jgi:hypothetical protein